MTTDNTDSQSYPDQAIEQLLESPVIPSLLSAVHAAVGKLHTGTITTVTLTARIAPAPSSDKFGEIECRMSQITTKEGCLDA